MLTKLSPQFRRTVYTGSIGKVLATYAPVEPSARPTIFSKKGFNERFFRFKNYFKGIFGIFFIQRSLTDFSRKKFVNNATKTYAKFLESFYNSDMNSLRSISTPNLYSDLSSKFQKLGIKIRAPGTPINITKLPSIVQILPVKMQIPETIEIYQITVRFDYEIGAQKHTDYVVFERSAAASDSAWRICGRITPDSNYF